MIFPTTFIDSETKLKVDLYIKSFDLDDEKEYIIKHQEELLPDWLESPKTIIFIFFQCKCALDGTNLRKEQLEKDRLLSKFNQLGLSFYNVCNKQGIKSEIICPKDGFPQYSRKGKNIFSIQTIVTHHLPSFKKEEKGCGLIHPFWGKAVYPCIMISLAEKQPLKPIIDYIFIAQNYKL